MAPGGRCVFVIAVHTNLGQINIGTYAIYNPMLLTVDVHIGYRARGGAAVYIFGFVRKHA